MSVQTKDAAYIAELARLNFSGPELEKMTQELNEILGYIEKLNELDTSTVEPLSHPLEMTNVFREDLAVPSTPQAEALKNAPNKDDSFFRAPKVISQ